MLAGCLSLISPHLAHEVVFPTLQKNVWIPSKQVRFRALGAVAVPRSDCRVRFGRGWSVVLLPRGKALAAEAPAPRFGKSLFFLWHFPVYIVQAAALRFRACWILVSIDAL